MTMPRESHTATRLMNGEVLIVGGHQGRRADITIYDSAELYDPSQGTFRLTGKMIVPRHKHDATLLADGRILISGGSDKRDAQGIYHSTEIFDAETGTFTLATEMHNARFKHADTSLLLPNKQVLLAGGASITEIYDPKSGIFHKVVDGIDMTRLFATTTLLSNGEILFAGGYGTHVAASRQAWVLKLAR